jgi:two-component system, OmpR family, phosphate regulon sensor histidine kinase PhoR
VKIKILLLIVALYLLGAFCWWTYSLITLSGDVHAHQIDLLKKESSLVKAVLKETFSTQNYTLQEGQNQTIRLENVSISGDSNIIKQWLIDSFGNQFKATFIRDSINFEQYELIVEPRKEQINGISSAFKSRKRAYYSEAVFFMILLIVGFGWLMNSLERIINLNKQQKNFMLSVSHELKTPVTSLQLSLQTLEKRTLTDEQKNTLINKASLGAERLSRLIENLLMAVKIEKKSFDTSFKPVLVNALIKEVISTYQTIKPFDGHISTQIDPEMMIWGDETGLKIICHNLIDNAIKYSKTPVNIAIKGQHKTLTFSDNGIGIPREERKKIFRPFYRIGDEHIRKTTGTGMGLYLVKNILKLHKAHIRVLPNTPNGSTFEITFK